MAYHSVPHIVNYPPGRKRKARWSGSFDIKSLFDAFLKEGRTVIVLPLKLFLYEMFPFNREKLYFKESGSKSLASLDGTYKDDSDMSSSLYCPPVFCRASPISSGSYNML
jgi:hypothetical protein